MTQEACRMPKDQRERPKIGRRELRRSGWALAEGITPNGDSGALCCGYCVPTGPDISSSPYPPHH